MVSSISMSEMNRPCLMNEHRLGGRPAASYRAPNQLYLNRVVAYRLTWKREDVPRIYMISPSSLTGAYVSDAKIRSNRSSNINRAQVKMSKTSWQRAEAELTVRSLNGSLDGTWRGGDSNNVPSSSDQAMLPSIIWECTLQLPHSKLSHPTPWGDIFYWSECNRVIHTVLLCQMYTVSFSIIWLLASSLSWEKMWNRNEKNWESSRYVEIFDWEHFACYWKNVWSFTNFMVGKLRAIYKQVLT